MPKQKYSSSYKVRTVLEGLKSPDGIAAYCRRQGISEVQFYQWQKQIIENADSVFAKVPKSVERKITSLEGFTTEKKLKSVGKEIPVVDCSTNRHQLPKVMTGIFRAELICQAADKFHFGFCERLPFNFFYYFNRLFGS